MLVRALAGLVAIPAVLLAAPPRVAAQAATPAAPVAVAETVTVVAVSPVAGLGVPADAVPAAIEQLDAAAIARQGELQVVEALTRRNASVSLSDTQGSTLQPDVQFRGFTGSALLGASQGLAVYQDGMRLNEPFGDTVQWSLLLPPRAIERLDVMPGANPLFGLNALGGALALQTRSGFSTRGLGASVAAGSWGRRWIDADYGAASDRLSLFLAMRALGEDGWRDFSDSSLGQLFANLGWRSEAATTVDLSFSAARNSLRGNGAVPVQLLEASRTAVFTHPDVTDLDHGSASLRVRHPLGTQTQLDVTGYFRPGTFASANGDDTDYEPCESPEAEWLCRDDDIVRDPAGAPVAAPVLPYSATFNRTRTRVRGLGATVQVSATRDHGSKLRRWLAGAAIDGGSSRFGASTEMARLTPDRGAIGTGVFDGDAQVGLETTAAHASAYAATFYSVTEGVTLSGSARAVSSRLVLRDQIGTDLDGDHQFASLNPAVGVTVAATPALTAYGSYSLSSRVPTPSELGCADPDDPCRLPNAFASDPPLKQVRAHAIEGGVRGRLGTARWMAGAFTVQSRDDLLFVSSGALTNQGYFTNVGHTRRSGVELRASGDTRGTWWSAGYTWLRPVFATSLLLPSDHHPEAVDGEIAVSPGDRLPGIPAHTVKADVFHTMGRLGLGASLGAASSTWLRGDEANLLDPVDGYVLAHLRARLRLTDRVSLSARVQNLFDGEYETFGLLGEADDVLGDGFDDPRFLSPGAPRAAWVGVELRLP